MTTLTSPPQTRPWTRQAPMWAVLVAGGLGLILGLVLAGEDAPPAPDGTTVVTGRVDSVQADSVCLTQGGQVECYAIAAGTGIGVGENLTVLVQSVSVDAEGHATSPTVVRILEPLPWERDGYRR